MEYIRSTGDLYTHDSEKSRNMSRVENARTAKWQESSEQKKEYGVGDRWPDLRKRKKGFDGTKGVVGRDLQRVGLFSPGRGKRGRSRPSTGLQGRGGGKNKHRFAQTEVKKEGGNRYLRRRAG